MKTFTLSEAKTKLNDLVEKVCTRDEKIVITRNGRPVAVLVSPDEFDSWKETTSICKNAKLMWEIRAGLSAQKAKKARLYTLKELFK